MPCSDMAIETGIFQGNYMYVGVYVYIYIYRYGYRYRYNPTTFCPDMVIIILHMSNSLTS